LTDKDIAAAAGVCDLLPVGATNWFTKDKT
jgi:hypothetical protein